MDRSVQRQRCGLLLLVLFITDAFVDMFITVCIVVNTVFMALDHAGMSAVTQGIGSSRTVLDLEDSLTRKIWHWP